MTKEAELLFIDPASDIYINIPNMSVAYAAAVYNAPVVDQHTLAYPKNRFLGYKAKDCVFSVRSFALREALREAKLYKEKYKDSTVRSLEALDVQCCYPFLKFDEVFKLGIEFSDSLPFPKWELFDSFNYLSTNWKVGLWHYPLLTSLGCPFSCSFCASGNRQYKARSIANCIEELKQAKEKYGIVSVEIIDDVFNLKKERVLEFCEGIKPLGLKFLCSNGLRADRFDEDQAKALSSSGCVGAGFGIESIDDNVLKSITKGETSADIEKAVISAKKYFKEVKGYFIIGLPGSSYEKDMKSMNWAQNIGIKPVVSYYVPESKKSAGSGDNIFYGTKAKALSAEYPAEQQKRVYDTAKQQVKELYRGQNLPLTLITKTLRAMTKYNINSLMTHFIIGPKRFLSILFKGEVQ